MMLHYNRGEPNSKSCIYFIGKTVVGADADNGHIEFYNKIQTCICTIRIPILKHF